MQDQLERVISYYNATVVDYKTLWMGPKDLGMHFGYHDGAVDTHEDSLLKMNEVLAGLARVSPGERVLDAGCGYGGSAFWLAGNVGCRVVGVNIVPNQVREARACAARQNISPHDVSFEEVDYASTPFPGGSFDVVLGLESIVHAESKRRFVEEAFRLLDSGGRLLISEYMLRDDRPLSADERRLIVPWLRGWAMPSLLSPSAYAELFTQAGFSRVEKTDLTEHVLPSLRRLWRLADKVLPVVRVLRAVRVIGRVHYGDLEATLCQRMAFESGLWRYTVVSGEKP